MKFLAISTGPSTHLDHLGVLATILNIPLIVTEEKTFQLAQRFYPGLHAILKEPGDLTLDFLAHWDKIFQCGQFWAMELRPLIELLYRKKIEILFCPHGNSDKGHSVSALPGQETALLYGQQMVDLYKEKSQVKKLILTGNYRYPYYREHQAFYNELAEKEIFSKLSKSKRTLLYAPSWNDGENDSTFFTSAKRVIEELTPTFNLILKLHPFLEEEHPAETAYLLSQYEKRESLLILQEFPPIYPLLARCDAYLGDFSSIGYDFLVFDKPLFFLSPPEKSLCLHRCGMTLSSEKEIASFIETQWDECQSKFSEARRTTYHYAFGEEKSFSQLESELYRGS
jgi:hypothetical protein